MERVGAGGDGSSTGAERSRREGVPPRPDGAIGGDAPRPETGPVLARGAVFTGVLLLLVYAPLQAVVAAVLLVGAYLVDRRSAPAAAGVRGVAALWLLVLGSWFNHVELGHWAMAPLALGIGCLVLWWAAAPLAARGGRWPELRTLAVLLAPVVVVLTHAPLVGLRLELERPAMDRQAEEALAGGPRVPGVVCGTIMQSSCPWHTIGPYSYLGDPSVRSVDGARSVSYSLGSDLRTWSSLVYVPGGRSPTPLEALCATHLSGSWYLARTSESDDRCP